MCIRHSRLLCLYGTKCELCIKNICEQIYRGTTFEKEWDATNTNVSGVFHFSFVVGWCDFLYTVSRRSHFGLSTPSSLTSPTYALIFRQPFRNTHTIQNLPSLPTTCSCNTHSIRRWLAIAWSSSSSLLLLFAMYKEHSSLFLRLPFSFTGAEWVWDDGFYICSCRRALFFHFFSRLSSFPLKRKCVCMMFLPKAVCVLSMDFAHLRAKGYEVLGTFSVLVVAFLSVYFMECVWEPHFLCVFFSSFHCKGAHTANGKWKMLFFVSVTPRPSYCLCAFNHWHCVEFANVHFRMVLLVFFFVFLFTLFIFYRFYYSVVHFLSLCTRFPATVIERRICPQAHKDSTIHFFSSFPFLVFPL